MRYIYLIICLLILSVTIVNADRTVHGGDSTIAGDSTVSGDITAVGTVTGEQITSTDDITASGLTTTGTLGVNTTPASTEKMKVFVDTGESELSGINITSTKGGAEARGLYISVSGATDDIAIRVDTGDVLFDENMTVEGNTTLNGMILTDLVPGNCSDGDNVTYALAGTKLECNAAGAGGGDVTSVGDECITGACDDINIADGQKIELNDVNMSGTAEGLFLGQTTDCSAATAEGQVCWETDANKLWVGNGGGVTEVGSGTSIWSTAGSLYSMDTDTDDVSIGAAAINTAKLSIDGDTDQVQFAIQGHATQTSNLVELEDSGGTVQFRIDVSGDATGNSWTTDAATGHYIEVNNATGDLPACDQEGRLTVDTTVNKLYICDGANWETVYEYTP